MQRTRVHFLRTEGNVANRVLDFNHNSLPSCSMFSIAIMFYPRLIIIHAMLTRAFHVLKVSRALRLCRQSAAPVTIPRAIVCDRVRSYCRTIIIETALTFAQK